MPAEPLRSGTFEFDVEDPLFVGSLGQDSYGLSLTAAFVFEALGIERGNDELVATGVLSKVDSRGVCPVDDISLQSKIEACRAADVQLVCPPQQAERSGRITPLPEDGPLESAIWVLGGTPLLEAITGNISDRQFVCRMLAKYCHAHVTVMHFPQDLSAAQSLCLRLIQDDNQDIRLSVVFNLASFCQTTRLPSESESVLHCMVGQFSNQHEFDQALARIMEEVFRFGAENSNASAFHVVACLLQAVATLYADRRLLDRLSPIGNFFRRIVDSIDPTQPKQPPALVVAALQGLGIRLDPFDIDGLQSRILDLLKQPSTRELLVKHDDRHSLAGIDYTLKLDDPFELFDIDRAYTKSLSDVTTIHLNHFGVSIRWLDGAGMFPPSIDTLHFLGDIAGTISESTVKNVVDIGSGTGVLGITDLTPVKSTSACERIQPGL